MTAVIAIALSYASVAGATLTDSEKAQVREFYAKGEAASSPRVRAMLARPDHTPADVTSAFADAARPVPFDDKHLIYVRDLLFGPATQASRSDLVPAIVSGLLARATEVAGAASDENARSRELIRIHGFVAREIAAAAKSDDPATGIRADATRSLVAAYRAHLALPVFDRARVPVALKSARMQAELALIALASGLFPATDVAAWIDADATERQALERTGVLVMGISGAPTPKATAVMRMLETVGPALGGASALWIGKPRPVGLASRGALLVAQAPLDGNKRAKGDGLWSRAVDPSSPDAALAEVAFVLAREAAAVALREATFAGAVDQALDRAKAGGEPALLAPGVLVRALDRDPGAPESAPPIAAADLLAGSIQLLLIDAQRAVSVALARSVAGRNEPAEQLALALSVLARQESGLKESVTLGKLTDAGGVAPIEVTKIKGKGLEVDELTIDGHAIAITRAADGSVAKLEQDKKPLVLAAIPFARVQTTAGDAWAGPKGGLALARLAGKPEVGFVDDTRFVVRPSASKGKDAVFLKASGDADVTFDMRVLNAPCGIIVRASASGADYAGATLVLEPGDMPRASWIARDGSGARVALGEAVSVPGGKGIHKLKLSIVKGVATAIIDGQTVSARLPDFLSSATGDLGFSPGAGGELEISNLKLAKRRK